ncbi:MAG: DsbA family protein [Candidatus Pacebacteria bacterium]|nr:DsbA family protein [Candidatus Paceibacterota bacterium]
MKNPWMITGVVTVLLFVAAIWYSGVSAERNNEGVQVLQHIKGGADATVTLVEYSDLECPACATFQPILAEIFAQHGDNLKFEYKHFPLPIHHFAQPAAMAAEAAGQQGKFFEFHDLLFANQQEWSRAGSPETFFIQYANELELDVNLFRKHMNSSVLRDKIRAEFDEGRKLNITGTPTFFLNGQRMNFDTYESFVGQIDAVVNPSLEAADGDSMAEPHTSPAGSGVRFGF